MKSNRRILLMAVFFGLVTVIAFYYYFQTLETPEADPVPYSNVVVARVTIPAHTRITPDMVETTSLPSEGVHPEAARNNDSILGGISRTEFLPGEQIMISRVFTEERRATLSYRVPEGMRAISIPVFEVTGVSGYIAPGDRVDILIAYNDELINQTLTVYTVFQNIHVMATGPTTLEKDSEEPQVVKTLTVAVTPEQAEVLAFATISGSFHITLRSPMDDTVLELDSYSFEVFDIYRER